MADQSIRFPEGLARDTLVKIQDNYVPVDFNILDMGADEEVPLILGRSFLHTTNTLSTWEQAKSTSNSWAGR